LLESVRDAAVACPEPVEVLVVDDSSLTEANEHRKCCAQYGARYLRGPRHVGAKRNLGARLASYDLLLFIDSDCRATTDSLRHHVEFLRGAGPTVAAVAGPTVVDTADTALHRIMARSFRANSAFDIPRYFTEAGWATTSNLAIRRSAFEAVGGFAITGLTVVGGEDVDLCTRLTQAGLRIRCIPAATVAHDAENTVRPAVVAKRLFTYGRSGQWLSVRYPHRQRAKLNPVTAVTAAAVVGVHAASRGKRWALLLAPAVAATLLATQVRARRRPGDSVRATADSALSVLMDWCFDAGEAVAAVQLRRPGLLMTEFGWFDDPAFKVRTADEPKVVGQVTPPAAPVHRGGGEPAVRPAQEDLKR
jgi:cellulose synthase/poly-beta-1,6-N-acetylglucosamine synthase-like glycosyltransferase